MNIPNKTETVNIYEILNALVNGSPAERVSAYHLFEDFVINLAIQESHSDRVQMATDFLSVIEETEQKKRDLFLDEMYEEARENINSSEVEIL